MKVGMTQKCVVVDQDKERGGEGVSCEHRTSGSLKFQSESVATNIFTVSSFAPTHVCIIGIRTSTRANAWRLKGDLDCSSGILTLVPHHIIVH